MAPKTPARSLELHGRRLLAALLVCYAAALVWEAWHLGVTNDEPSHLAADYMYWRGEDVLFPSDTPPLTRMISGWAPHLFRVPSQRDAGYWKSQNAYDVGWAMLILAGASTAHWMVFLTRLPFSCFRSSRCFWSGTGAASCSAKQRLWSWPRAPRSSRPCSATAR